MKVFSSRKHYRYVCMIYSTNTTAKLLPEINKNQLEKNININIHTGRTASVVGKETGNGQGKRKTSAITTTTIKNRTTHLEQTTNTL